MSTLSLIAKELDISISTVSRCLNNDETLQISDITRRSIVNFANEIGYISKKNKDKPTILIYYYKTDEEDMTDPFFVQIKDATIKYCENNSIKYVFYPRFEIPNFLVNVQGVIAIGTFADEEIDYLHNLSNNITFVNSFPDLNKYDSVVVDDRIGVKRALSHFSKQKVDNILFIGADEFVPGSTSPKFNYRLEYFKYYINYYSFKHSNVVVGEYSYESGYKIIKEMVDLPKTILCASDSIAKGCVDALLERNVRIPNDIQIIGFNNDESSYNGEIKISTVGSPIESMVQTAVDNVIQKNISEGSINRRILLPTELILRDTTLN